jgi:hypothetical protein
MEELNNNWDDILHDAIQYPVETFGNSESISALHAYDIEIGSTIWGLQSVIDHCLDCADSSGDLIHWQFSGPLEQFLHSIHIPQNQANRRQCCRTITCIPQMISEDHQIQQSHQKGPFPQKIHITCHPTCQMRCHTMHLTTHHPRIKIPPDRYLRYHRAHHLAPLHVEFILTSSRKAVEPPPKRGLPSLPLQPLPPPPQRADDPPRYHLPPLLPIVHQKALAYPTTTIQSP